MVGGRFCIQHRYSAPARLGAQAPRRGAAAVAPLGVPPVTFPLACRLIPRVVNMARATYVPINGDVLAWPMGRLVSMTSSSRSAAIRPQTSSKNGLKANVSRKQLVARLRRPVPCSGSPTAVAPPASALHLKEARDLRRRFRRRSHPGSGPRMGRNRWPLTTYCVRAQMDISPSMLRVPQGAAIAHPADDSFRDMDY